MWKTRKYTKGLFFLLVALMLWSVACSREEKFIGTYKSAPGNPSEYSDLFIELKKGGEGIRRVHGKEFTFQWVVKSDEMRVRTRSGGIIVGKLQGRDMLEVRLPGPKIIHLQRIK